MRLECVGMTALIIAPETGQGGDSRFRGNDVGVCGNDVDGGNEVGDVGMRLECVGMTWVAVGVTEGPTCCGFGAIHAVKGCGTASLVFS